MSLKDWAPVASAIIAFLCMAGSGVAWVQAREEKKAAALENAVAAEHRRRAVEASEAAVSAEHRSADAAERSAGAADRSADAGERAAAAQEAMVAASAAADAVDREAPWQLERGRGSIVWLLRNRLPKRAYGVVLSAPAIKDGAQADRIDGHGAHEFFVINGQGRPLTVSWHWKDDLTDEVPPWTGMLP